MTHPRVWKTILVLIVCEQLIKFIAVARGKPANVLAKAKQVVRLSSQEASPGGLVSKSWYFWRRLLSWKKKMLAHKAGLKDAKSTCQSINKSLKAACLRLAPRFEKALQFDRSFSWDSKHGQLSNHRKRCWPCFHLIYLRCINVSLV